MALNQTEAASSGVWGAVQGALKLFSDINKAKGVTENGNPQPIDEYESSYSEEEVISLIGQWKKTYSAYYNDVEPSQQLAFEYWIGKQSAGDLEVANGNTLLVDNKIFEAIETFIPVATRANPDPLVQADPTLIGKRLARDLKNALVTEADRQKLRKILKKALRHWLIYRIGIIKLSYNVDLDQIETTVINPKRMIFDKDGHWDEAGFFTGEYIGEKKKATASTLIKMFPRKKAEILEKAQEKKGTKLEYFEWWYRRRDVFYTLDDLVLGKFKNPHWNYDIPEKAAIEPTYAPADDMEYSEPAISGDTPALAPGADTSLEGGVPIAPEQQLPNAQQAPQAPQPGAMLAPGVPAQPGQPGINHFKEPRDPYIGLSIFSTGLQPHDETSLIIQNIGIQDMINRRWRQIDKNVDGMNNGMIVDSTFTAEQASQAASALRRGVAIRVPGSAGSVGDHVQRFPAPPLPTDVFQTMQDGRNELRNIFGTSGSTPEGVNNQDTVRGKILVNQLDSSRIGGGVTEYLEQMADSWYNWVVQMMFVHYTDEHYIVTAGMQGGENIISLKNTAFTLVKSLNITVKEGSLVPKDPLTQRNEAIDLWSAEAIDPRTLFDRLEFPDPNEATKQLLLWQMVKQGAMPPQAYIPDFPMPPMQVGMPGQPGGAPGTPSAPGVGGQPVNPVGPATPGQPPAAGTQGAVGQESQQLIRSIPLQ